MLNIAFIAEFNPPHKGHAYFVKYLRDHFGQDASITAIMSGNYVQRGTPAVIDAYTRSQMALQIGVDLVIELPYPFSSSTAEIFARSGVTIAENIGTVDYLAFGSECGDINMLTCLAEYLLSETFKCQMDIARAIDRESSFASLREAVIKENLGDKYADILKEPNNILAIEYIRALISLKSTIKPYTVKRIGSYHSTVPSANALPSSSMLREFISRQNFSFEKYMGRENTLLLQAWLRDGYYTDEEAVSRMTLAKILSSCSSDTVLPPDCSVDLYERILKGAGEVTSVDELVDYVRAKHETEAHVRRVILYMMLGTKANSLKASPSYTRVLAANKKGCTLLRQIQKKSTISILTKTADYKKMSTKNANLQSELAIFADKVYNLCMKTPRKASDAMRCAPFIGD